MKDIKHLISDLDKGAMRVKKICPTCKRQYTDLECFCRDCGIQLVKNPNRCSERKTAMCKDAVFEDEARYCSYCGAPTVYAKPLIDEMKRW